MSEAVALGEILLAGRRLQLLGNPAVQYNQLGTFERRVIFGDPGLDDDDVISSRVYSDGQGGVGVEDEDEGVHTDRLAWEMGESRFRRLFALPPLATNPAAPGGASGTSRPMGDIGARYYHAWGTNLYAWTGSAWSAATNIGAEPTGKPTEYDGWWYIPLSGNGYKRVRESAPGTLDNAHAIVASITAVDFEVFDDKLYALETDGQMSKTVVGAVVGDWITESGAMAGVKTKVGTPRQLVSFFDRGGSPTLFALTNRHGWQYADIDPSLRKTHLQFNPHPDSALSATVWRPGEDLWVTVGMDIYRVTSGHVYVPNSGLARDDGLPAAFQGALVDLTGTVDSLYGLLRGDSVGTSGSETFIGESGLHYDDPTYLPVGTSFPALMANNGVGWHCIWQSPTTETGATWSIVSEALSTYRLWWGVGSKAWYMDLRKTLHNPRRGVERGVDSFGLTAFFDYPKFDAGMAGFQKIGSDIYARVLHASATEIVRYYHRTNAFDWTQLGADITEPGNHRVYMGVGVDGDNPTFSAGVPFEWHQLRLALERTGAATQTPLVQGTAFHYVKVPQDTATHTVTLALPPEGYDEQGPDELRDFLDGLVRSARFYPLTVLATGTEYRVRVASNAGADVGGGIKGARTATLVEIGGGDTRRRVA